MFIAHDPNRQQLTRLQMHDQFSFIKENNHLKSHLNYCMLVDTSLVAEHKDHQYVFTFLKYDAILFRRMTEVSVDASVYNIIMTIDYNNIP